MLALFISTIIGDERVVNVITATSINGIFSLKRFTKIGQATQAAMHPIYLTESLACKIENFPKNS